MRENLKNDWTIPAETSRIWIFPLAVKIEGELASSLLTSCRGFVEDWKAHGRELRAEVRLIYGRFIVVALDTGLEAASGCSIDALFKGIESAAISVGTKTLDNNFVFYRTPDSAEIQAVPRSEFGKLSMERKVNLDTLVFDNTIQTLDALMSGKWEKHARDSWHARAFFE